MATPLFVSYSHRDKDEKDQLCGMLEALPEVDVDVWSDARIRPGEQWEEQIEAALGRAKLALLLITRDFLNSQFIQSKELPQILRRHGESSLVVVPVIARSCPWNLVAWLAKLQALPDGGSPVWSDASQRVDDKLNQIAQEIHRLLRDEPRGAERNRNVETVAQRMKSMVDDLTGLAEPGPTVPGVVSAFREDLRATRERIQSVAYYKDLHDELHTIHTRCYRQLADNARWFPGEASVRTSFLAIQADLETSVEELTRIRSRPPRGVASAPWVGSLEEAARNLSTANEQEASDVLTRVITVLRQVLNTVPGRLDSRLNEAARKVDVGHLVQALRTAREPLLRGNAEPRRLAALEEGEANLTELERDWSALIQQHSGWEEVESTLRLIDESHHASPTGDSTADDLLRASFDSLTDAVATLIQPTPGDSLERLATAHEKLDAALARGDIAGARNHYVSFRSLAGRRFENLDKQLKELCHSMVALGGRLESILA